MFRKIFYLEILLLKDWFFETSCMSIWSVFDNCQKSIILQERAQEPGMSPVILSLTPLYLLTAGGLQEQEELWVLVSWELRWTFFHEIL